MNSKWKKKYFLQKTMSDSIKYGPIRFEIRAVKGVGGVCTVYISGLKQLNGQNWLVKVRTQVQSSKIDILWKPQIN